MRKLHSTSLTDPNYWKSLINTGLTKLLVLKGPVKSTEPWARKVSFPVFPMAQAQESCCSNAKAAPASGPVIDADQAQRDGLQLIAFRIDGMSCSCEGQMVEKRVKSLKGVKDVSLNPITNQMKLIYDASALSVKDIETAVRKAGAKAVPVASR